MAKIGSIKLNTLIRFALPKKQDNLLPFKLYLAKSWKIMKLWPLICYLIFNPLFVNNHLSNLVVYDYVNAYNWVLEAMLISAIILSS